MTWLLRLYPPPWRQRYGAEVAEMLSHERFSLRVAIDLIAGAIDVWLHPAATMAAVSTTPMKEEEGTMLNRIARLECAFAAGPDVTKADQWKAAVVTVGGTIVLTLIWMAVHIRIGDNAYVDSLSLVTFMFPMFYAMRYTYLKNRPGSVQAVFIGGMSLLLVAFMLAVGWVAAQL